MAQHDIIVSIRDLDVKYDGLTALESVNLDIYNDDFLGIIGPNGGGKSSLIKAIMGTTPYAGEIRFPAFYGTSFCDRCADDGRTVWVWGKIILGHCSLDDLPFYADHACLCLDRWHFILKKPLKTLIFPRKKWK